MGRLRARTPKQNPQITELGQLQEELLRISENSISTSTSLPEALEQQVRDLKQKLKLGSRNLKTPQAIWSTCSLLAKLRLSRSPSR